MPAGKGLAWLCPLDQADSVFGVMWTFWEGCPMLHPRPHKWVKNAVFDLRMVTSKNMACPQERTIII
jgi:hypothetical protein